ncbi:MAG: UPF0175 family protein [Microcoleaceae cyanobacterium]
MSTQPAPTPIQFTLQLSNIPDAIHQEAELNAKEAYVMTLLRHGIISSGRAARLLGIPRVDIFERMSQYQISPFDDTLTQAQLRHQVAQAQQILEQNNP